MENTMTNIEAQSPVILTGRKLSAVRTGWWVLFVIYAIFRAFSTWYNFTYYAQSSLDIFSNILTLIVFIVTTILALTLFIKKSDDWAVICVTAMFFTWQTDAQHFFGWLINHGLYDLRDVAHTQDTLLTYVFSLPSDFLGYLAVMGGFLTFPTGRWISPGAQRAFRCFGLFLVFSLLCLPLILLSDNALAVSIFMVSFKSIMLVVVQFIPGYILFRHYRTMGDSSQRQQIKWIVIFFMLLACAYAILIPAILVTIFFVDYAFGWVLVSVTTLVAGLINLGIFGAFSLSILRYRLWDIEILINRTLVYGTLTGALGLIGLVSLAVIDFFIKRFLGDESSIWGVVISALPVAAAFNPLRDRLQSLIDHYFKPEEINFENHFLEFRADVRGMLDTSRILEVIIRQVKRQLDVESARVYLADEYDEIPSLSLSNKNLKTLVAGDLVIGEDNADYSLLVPLVIARPVIPDFIGVIILGRRLNGRGYSTPMLDSLKLLGANAGEAIYLSQLNERSKIKVME